MTAITSSQLELLRAKLALAIGPLDVNLLFSDVEANRPNALDEPWSDDMSGPHKHIVFDNKDFVLFEAENEQQASSLARGCPPIDVGENIKLYLNDVWQSDIFRMMGFDMATIRDPVTGRDPMGSLYYSLIESVNECILKKPSGADGVKKDGSLEKGDVGMDDGGDEVGKKEQAGEEPVVGNRQENQDGDEVKGGEQGTVKQVNVEEDNHGHADAVMEG